MDKGTSNLYDFYGGSKIINGVLVWKTFRVLEWV